MRDRLRVAVVARSVHGLHGFGGLERHVDDLVRHLARLDVEVTLVTRPPRTRVIHALPAKIVQIPYVTFPGAGRRGTTVIDRSTRVPAVRVARRPPGGRHGPPGLTSTSSTAWAPACSATRSHAAGSPTCRAPLVLNPQGLEEFGATDPLGPA